MANNQDVGKSGSSFLIRTTAQSPKMKSAEFHQRLSSLKIWRRQGKRAPHKPLLLLLAFGHFYRGSPRLRAYREIEYELRELLVRFGPPRRKQSPIVAARLAIQARAICSIPRSLTSLFSQGISRWQQRLIQNLARSVTQRRARQSGFLP